MQINHFRGEKQQYTYEDIYYNISKSMREKDILQSLFLPYEEGEFVSYVKSLKRNYKNIKIVSESEINRKSFEKLINTKKQIVLLVYNLDYLTKEFIMSRILKDKPLHIVITSPLLNTAMKDFLEFLNKKLNVFVVNIDILEELEFNENEKLKNIENMEIEIDDEDIIF